MSSSMAQHPPAKANAITYGKSWAEDVQKYHAAKASLPWSPEQQPLVKYVTRFEKAREEREYDLVLGKFRDNERELTHTRQEKHLLENTLEHARAKQLRNVQRFDVVTHAPMFPDAKDPSDRPPQPHPYRIKMASAYNIISNEPNNNSDNTNNGSSATLAGPAPSKRPTREFNILTNEYHEHHAARAHQDAVTRKEVAATKYYKARSFDPVRVTFVDEAKERAFVQDRAREQQAHGKDRVLLLPPREQFAEGRLYNIVNQRVLNAEKLAAASEKDRRALNTIQKSAFEARMRTVGDETLAKETAKCLNRFAHERNAQTYVHGYDPISNEAFDGRDAKPKVPTRTHATLPAWQTLESSGPSGHAKSSATQHKATATAAVPSHTAHAGEMPLTGSASAASSTRQVPSESQRANIFVVERAPQTSSVIRTGGFSH